MREKATERVDETRRHSEEDDEITPERKQRRRNSEVIAVLKGSLEMKRKEQEQAGQLREREIVLMERQFQRQDEFQRAMMEQQQQFQQQQTKICFTLIVGDELQLRLDVFVLPVLKFW